MSSDQERLFATFVEFMEQITKEPDLRAKFTSANTSFLVDYTDLPVRLLVDCTVDPPLVDGTAGADAAADVRLKMTTEDNHRFWLGDLNATVALARKKIEVSGSMTKMLKLLPAMQPAFPRYRAFLTERGLLNP